MATQAVGGVSVDTKTGSMAAKPANADVPPLSAADFRAYNHMAEHMVRETIRIVLFARLIVRQNLFHERGSSKCAKTVTVFNT